MFLLGGGENNAFFSCKLPETQMCRWSISCWLMPYGWEKSKGEVVQCCHPMGHISLEHFLQGITFLLSPDRATRAKFVLCPVSCQGQKEPSKSLRRAEAGAAHGKGSSEGKQLVTLRRGLLCAVRLVFLLQLQPVQWGSLLFSFAVRSSQWATRCSFRIYCSNAGKSVHLLL